MRYVLALLLIIEAIGLSASTSKSITQVELPNGNVAKLYWEQKYEGYNTLHRIDSEYTVIDLKKLDAAGQPEFDAKSRFLALPYCAHDGCLNKVNIFDLKKMKLLSPIHIEFEGQMYLKCKWNDSILSIKVEDYIHSDNKMNSYTNRYKVTDDGISRIY